VKWQIALVVVLATLAGLTWAALAQQRAERAAMEVATYPVWSMPSGIEYDLRRAFPR